jgi:N-acyl-D-amino-acid deacylase
MTNRLPSRALLCLIAASACSSTPPDGFLVTNAQVIDGSGAARKPASVRVRGDSIVEVGTLSAQPGEAVVDAGGLVLAPGFIDTHSHADGDLREDTTALGAVSQGITTIIGGQDGGSNPDIRAFLAELEGRPVAVNVGTYVGHGTLRMRAMGEDFRRVATQVEVDSMRGLLRAALDGGALGLSTGLEYDPGIYSSTDEVLALAKDVAAAGGRYISHIRSEDYAFWKAIDEIIRIGREARLPVQISHAKLAMRDLWGRADSLVRILEGARKDGVDITADIYPYLFWQSTLTVLFPKRDFENRASANFALTQTTTPGGLRLAVYLPKPEYQGKTLAEIATLRGVDSVTALIDLIRDAERMRKEAPPEFIEGKTVESIIATSMVEEDVAAIMRWPFTNFCTDGSFTGSHPRGFGSFPRILGKYVRGDGVMSLEEAVRRGTSLAAHNMGIAGRGTIAPGMKADLVLFDPAAVIDRATPDAPHEVSTGVQRVWVNGREVFADGRATGAPAGQVVRRR